MADLVYNRAKYNLLKSQYEGHTIKAALLKNTYTPDKDHSIWADILSHEVSGTGYTAGGKEITSKAFYQDDANDKASFDAVDVTWADATLTARYAVLKDDTLTNKDLICIWDFGADKSIDEGEFILQFHSSGILEMS